MNKTALKKNTGTHVRLRPIPKRFFGADGPQLPPVDDTWILEGVDDSGVRIRNTRTPHGTVLGFDQVHHYATDPARGAGNGFLILNTQLHFGGNALWTEPTFRPGEALPDQFGDVRDWDRRNDATYVQSLYLSAQSVPASVPRPAITPAQLLLTGLCIAGLALAISRT
jgi:hypothetical protein